MQIREIGAEETPALRECIMQLSAHHNRVSVHFKGSFPGRPYAETIRIFTESLQKGESRIAVAEDGDTIAGFCKVDTAGDSGKLDYLIVLPAYRRKGYGTRLMDWAMETFHKFHIRNIEVKVIDGNEAIRLYEKYGFRTKAHILCYREDTQ